MATAGRALCLVAVALCVGCGAAFAPRPAARPLSAGAVRPRPCRLSSVKTDLLDTIDELEQSGAQRGSSPVAANKRLNELVQRMAQANPTPRAVREDQAKLAGTWRLVFTVRANSGLEEVEWLSYLFGENGPSPIQRFVIGSTKQVGKVYQVLELDAEGGRFNNFIDFREALGGVLNLQAEVTGFTGGTQLDIRFDNAYFSFEKNPVTKAPLDKPLRVPYPVPFRLLPNESRGLLDNIYVDDDLRLARGNKGTVFVLRREDDAEFPAIEFM